MLSHDLIIYTDGGARGNPGHAGIGAVLLVDEGNGNEKIIAEIKKYIGEQTNNYAEYTALIEALTEGAKLGYKNVKCFLDSELVVKQMKGEYKVKEPSLKPLATQVLALTNKFFSVTFNHVPREQNQLADELVNEAIDEYLESNS